MGETRTEISERMAAHAVSDPASGGPVVTHPNLAAGPVTGQTLESMLRGSVLPTELIAVIGIGILAGLRALHRAGGGHESLDPAAVLVAPNGHARLVGHGAGSERPDAEIMAAGRVICAALGVSPEGKWLPSDRARARLASAARLIAAGGAGLSATNALMTFGDAAGRVTPGFWIERTVAGIERLGVPPPPYIGAAVDRLMANPAPPVRRPPPEVARPAARESTPRPLPAPAARVAPVVAAAASPASVEVEPRPAKPEARPTQPEPRPARPEPAATTTPPSDAPRPPRAAAIAAPAATPSRKVAKPVPRPGRRAGLVAMVAAAVILVAAAVGYHHSNARVAVRPISSAPSLAAAQAVPPAVATSPVAVPETVVSDYYRLVAARKFDQALALWDGHLRDLLGPSQYPQQRFADTTELLVNSDKVVSQDGSTASVKVDLTEVTDGVQHHWAGTWRLVQSGGTWLLDEPDFAPV